MLSFVFVACPCIFLSQNWFSTGDGFLSSLQADMSLQPECLIAKWSTALSVKHPTKIRFFFPFLARS